MDYQRLFLDHLDVIDQIARKTFRRRHLSAADREDFVGFARLRLVEGNYAILRKFRGRSTMHTYLVAVIDRLSIDFMAERWGRWRPSAMAERLGPVAVELEKLVQRDGHSLDEAVEMLRTHPDVDDSAADLLEIWQQLPARIRTTEVGEEAASGVAGDDDAEVLIDDACRRRGIERLQQVLRTAFADISARDRIMIALHFDEKLTITKIAALTGGSEPTLRRRLRISLNRLETALRRSGLEWSEVVDLIGHPSLALSPLLRAEVDRFFKHGRLSERDG